MLKKYGFAAVFALFFVINALPVAAQRPRTADDNPNQVVTPPPPAPSTVKAKYEGGVFGYNKKKTGKLTIDNANSRLVFKDDKGKEMFHIPYGSITGAYGDSHYKRPAAATVISHVPLYGIPASFIKTKVRYLTIQYDDPDSKAAGVTSFRLDNKDLLDSVLYTVATQAGLKKRGDIYIRKKE
ncbi:MAG TPA: hypothetical protein VJV21_04825 [Pyrinomonadaceae bacterium]|nr:hypothetical protein [Pyrinomonadaceae bacterium]